MSWLPSDMKKSIVMIGERDENEPIARPIGSGALLRFEKYLFVVTAKHVVENISDPLILINDVKGRIKGYKTSNFTSEFGFEWRYHSDKEVDLAAIRFGYEKDVDDVKVIPPNMFNEFSNVEEGDDVFFMGFPLGLTNLNKLTPAIRQGCVSLKLDSEIIIGKMRYAPKTIIIDGQVSSGNSGSPVFRKPVIEYHTRKLGPLPPQLFGIVTAHVESKIFDLNKKPIAKENSGLGIVTATDHIIDLLEKE